jgi:hypothetical protein
MVQWSLEDRFIAEIEGRDLKLIQDRLGFV